MRFVLDLNALVLLINITGVRQDLEKLSGGENKRTKMLGGATRFAPLQARLLCTTKLLPSRPSANALRLPKASLQSQSRMQSSSALQSDPMTGEATGYSDIDASALIVEASNTLKKPPPSSTLIFGRSFSDHMISIPWNSASGWAAPRIHPYGPIQLDPSAMVLHYAPCLFEGMKAYKDINGRVRLFRPDMNMARMNISAQRIALPVSASNQVNNSHWKVLLTMIHPFIIPQSFSGKDLTKVIAKLASVDAGWIPSEPGYSLYLRPTMIGTEPALGVHPTAEALLFVITSPVGPYYKTGFKPVALEADPTKVRAWPGGTGQYKLGGNYAPGIKLQMEAATRGYQQNLWLFGEQHWLTEVGTMNLFVALKNENGCEF